MLSTINFQRSGISTTLLTLDNKLSLDPDGVLIRNTGEFRSSSVLLVGSVKKELKVEIGAGEVPSRRLSKLLSSLRKRLRVELAKSVSPCSMATTRDMLGRLSAEFCVHTKAISRIRSISISWSIWRLSLGSISSFKRSSSRSVQAHSIR